VPVAAALSVTRAPAETVWLVGTLTKVGPATIVNEAIFEVVVPARSETCTW